MKRFDILRIIFVVLYCARNVCPLDQSDSEYWQNQGYNSLKHSVDLSKQNIVRKARNVILFLGDGMGVSTVTAARRLKQENSQIDNLKFDSFPNTCLIKTYNVDFPVPDSAGTGTAYLTGVKTNKGLIGVNAKVKLNDNNCDNILKNKVDSVFMQAIAEGKSSGVVTTASITDATPAAAYAHVSNRDDEFSLPFSSEKCKDIARQLVEDSPGKDFNVILGGGRKNFLPKSNGGVREDNLNLFDHWLQYRNQTKQSADSYKLIKNRNELLELNPNTTNYLFGSFSYNNMKYDKNRSNSKEEEPSLSEMTEIAIRILNKNPEGFFLLVEGAKIDKAHHANRAYQALYDTLAFDKAIEKAIEMVNLEETLVLVTADHSHGFTMNGYANGSVSIFGSSQEKDANNKTYTTLLYATGPGHNLNKKNETLYQTANPEYQQNSLVEIESGSHGGEDVGAYGIGPMSHLLRSTKEQTFIAHLMSFSACIKPYQNEAHCNKSNFASVCLLSKSYVLVFVIAIFYIHLYHSNH